MQHEETPQITKVNVEISYNSFASPDFRIRHLLIKCDYAMTQDMILKSIKNYSDRMYKEYEKLNSLKTLNESLDENLLPEVRIYISPRMDHKEVLFTIIIMEETQKNEIAQLTDAVFLYYLNTWKSLQEGEK